MKKDELLADANSNTVAYFGVDSEKIVLAHPQMAEHIAAAVEELTHAVVRVYVEARNPTGLLRWDIAISSPKGRMSYQASQYGAANNIHIDKTKN